MNDYVVISLGPDGLVSSWSPGAEQLLGYGADELRARPVTRLLADVGDANDPIRGLAAAEEPGDPVARHGWCVHKDGRRIPVLIEIHPMTERNSTISGYVGVIRAAATPLISSPIDSDFQFRRFVDSVVDYAIYLLDATGLVSSWNTGAERIKGYSSSEIIGQHFSRFYTDEDRAGGEPTRALALATSAGKYEKIGWRVRKDGTRFWANVVIDSIRDDAGSLMGFVKVTRDVSEQLAAQTELEQIRNAFAHSKRLEAVGQLTSGVAHGFNNLLTVMINALDLMEKGPADAHRNAQLIHDARQAAQRGAMLTQQMLAFSRNRSLQPAQHRIEDLMRELGPMLQHAAGEAIALQFLLAQASSSVYVDVAQFETAMLNLIVNARDAMPAGGDIRIRAAHVDLASEHAAAAIPVECGAYAAISVSDCGCGIAPEILDRVLEPFYTTKEVGFGSGLGLSQVYGFATQSGGGVTVASEVGCGTTVTIYLPELVDVSLSTVNDGGPAVADPIKADAGIGRGSGTILLVEDDEYVRQSTIDVLRLLGYKVLVATNGPEAIGILRHEPDIDVLCSDIVMPYGMSGVELAHEATRMRPGLRILLLSGYAGNTAMPLSHDEFAFLAKPYRLQELSDQLRALMAATA
jgi:PAS domain S-box-containing protein